MDWDDVKVFLAVAEAGSLRSAAARLKVSQPTIGRRLALLEAESGSGSLFERTPQGHEATGWGASLLPAARAMQEAALVFERELALVKDAITATIRVAAHEWTGQIIVARSDLFRDQLPGIKLEFAAIRRGGRTDLARRDADICIFEGPKTPAFIDDSLVLRPLGALSFGIYAAPALLRSGDAAHDPVARFADCPWVAYDDDAILDGGGEASLAPHRWLEARISAQAARMRCTGSAMLVSAARAGAGLAVLPRVIGDAEPGLVRIADELEGEPPVDLWIGVHRDLNRSRCVGATRDLLVTLFQDAG